MFIVFENLAKFMACPGLIVFLLLQSWTCVVNSFETTKSNRFFDGAVLTREDARLLHHQIDSIKTVSVISCAQACLANPHCVSTNVQTKSRPKLLCELNDSGISEWLEDENDLDHQEGFLYTQYFIQQDLCPRGGRCYRTSCEKHRESNIATPRAIGLPSCCCCPLLAGVNCGDSNNAIVFNFTTLGAVGKQGPSSNMVYPGNQMQNVTIHNGIQHWRVPISGKYEIVLHGASGGNGTAGYSGGRGATVNGTMYLSRGTEIKILVGQQGLSGGPSYPGSGGGGTFVVLASPSSSPISVAGGGGGGGVTEGDPGQDGTRASPDRAGGNNMAGGLVCLSGGTNDAGAGGGYHGNGQCHTSGECTGKFCVQGGKSFLNGGEGGSCSSYSNCEGGFGGGGACTYIPGGGGGYSGGGVKFKLDGVKPTGVAGGGGSYKLYNNWTVLKGEHTGDGFVLFRLLP